MQGIENFLGPLDGKGGNNDFFAPAVAVGDGLGQFVEAFEFAFMIAIAVSGFHKKVVRVVKFDRVFHEQLVGPADVAGENKLLRTSPVFDEKLHNGRAENVARVLKAHREARSRTEGFAVFLAADTGQNGSGVVLGVKRDGISFLTAAQQALVAACRLRLLNVSAVEKQNFQQIAGWLSGVNRPGKTGFRDAGQKARMIDVRVGDEDKVDARRVIGRHVPVAPFNGIGALMHAAVHRKARSIRLHHKTRPGHGPRGSQKLNFHERLISLPSLHFTPDTLLFTPRA